MTGTWFDAFGPGLAVATVLIGIGRLLYKQESESRDARERFTGLTATTADLAKQIVTLERNLTDDIYDLDLRLYGFEVEKQTLATVAGQAQTVRRQRRRHGARGDDATASGHRSMRDRS